MIITKYYHVSMCAKFYHSVIFKDQCEGVVMVTPPNIWYLCKCALYMTPRLKAVTFMLSE